MHDVRCNNEIVAQPFFSHFADAVDKEPSAFLKLVQRTLECSRALLRFDSKTEPYGKKLDLVTSTLGTARGIYGLVSTVPQVNTLVYGEVEKEIVSGVARPDAVGKLEIAKAVFDSADGLISGPVLLANAKVIEKTTLNSLVLPQMRVVMNIGSSVSSLAGNCIEEKALRDQLAKVPDSSANAEEIKAAKLARVLKIAAVVCDLCVIAMGIASLFVASTPLLVTASFLALGSAFLGFYNKAWTPTYQAPVAPFVT